MVHYKLIYFDGRGLAESARQLFALADQEYEDVRLTKEQFATLKPSFPFGQVPVLEVDGKQIAQSLAINRYLAKTFGFAGKTPIEEAMVDSLGDQYTDYRTEIKPYFYALLGHIPGDLEQLKKDVMVPARDKFLGFLTNILKKNTDSGFLVGNSLTWVDVMLAEHIADISKKVPDFLDGFPEVKAHMEKVQSNPKIKKWVESRPQTSF